MTQFEFVVPLVALAVALGLVVYLRVALRRLDAAHKDRHPAE